MIEIPEKLSEKTYGETIENIVSLVFDEKIWVEEEMWKICEITYGYLDTYENKEKIKLEGKNIVINSNIFCKLGKLNIGSFQFSKDEEKKESLLKAYKVAINKIDFKIKQIEKYIKILEKIEIKNDLGLIYKIKILIGSLKEKKLLLEYNKNGSIYELEKAGIKININNIDIQEIDKKQKKIDKEVFGGDIKENEKEKNIIYNKFKETIELNKNNLSINEYNKINNYIERIDKKNLIKKKNIKNIKNLITIFDNNKIKRANYIKGFNLFIEKYDQMNFKVEINNDIKSISDGPKGFQVPGNKDFENITVSRFLCLNAHENETHNISEHNSNLLIGNIRGSGSTEKDEGIAILMENMIKYGKQIFKKDQKSKKYIIDIEKLEISNNFGFILMGEILKESELLDFLQIFYKCEEDIISPENRFLRLKRANKKLVQHKDCSYIRGLFRVCESINEYITSSGKSGNSFYDMFLGKVGINELKYLKKIKEKNDIKTMDPIFGSDIILFSLLIGEDKNGKIDFSNFYKYLEVKYPFLDINKKDIKSYIKNKEEILNKIISLCKNIDENKILDLEKSNTKIYA